MALSPSPTTPWPMAGLRLLLNAALGLIVCLAAALPVRAQEDDRLWISGAYSFSDELGGFVIEGVSGTGTRDDPIVLRERFASASPVTLVIRTVRPIRPFDSNAYFANGVIHMTVQARNGSGQGWIEFEFELQEILGTPSTFGDGLSFDQRRSDSDSIRSDSFAHHKREFEPGDKLLFKDGKVDPGATASFSFLITDFTPTPTLYLLQDPRIPTM